MNKINLKGITSEAITNVIMLIVALINTILQMRGVNTLPIENQEVSVIVSWIFLVCTALWNTWKNRNVTTAAQEVQQIADALKNGALLIEDVQTLISKIKK